MSRKQTPLRPYFEKMPEIGKQLREGEVRRSQANLELVREQEEIIAQEVERVKKAGMPAEKIHQRGGMTRPRSTTEPGTHCTLSTTLLTTKRVAPGL